MKTDVIITYVNSNDAEWRKSYSKALGNKLMNINRYRSYGTLKYLMRGIAKHMPWVNNVILIVASDTQVPNWVNRNTVRVVKHSEFIPKEFLPTFNSCTIESFFWNIKGLSENIIYINDDTFPINDLSIRDFFNLKPCNEFKFYKNYQKNNMFRRQCHNGAKMIYNILKEKGATKKEFPIFFKPVHSMTAISRDSLINVGKLCSSKINKTITRLRDIHNINQHIYLYYQYFTDNYIDGKIDYSYVTFNNDIHEIKDIIMNRRHNIICINDSGIINSSVQKNELRDAFKHIFPEPSKYEI